ncbi:DNA repair protein RadC [Fictibacillus sp. KIGAM418]|uniref:DNA repair protein RadC n=1 Tax=Fictibacillus marinisediminis TaxID=2878389 RepID=A0A9X1XGN5_9BACL|nr:DNA repair protein RadC [Fictibacillus marinisediminis]MCK6259565.1 DNA repair protein RadC [Fictibacillus marinisediminis]
MKSQYLVAKESLAVYGADQIDLQALLSNILGPKTPAETTGFLSALGIRRLVELSETELSNVPGLSKSNCIKLKAAFGLFQKLSKSLPEKRIAIKSPEDAADCIMEELRYEKQERFLALYLNTRNEIIRKRIIFVGTLNSSVVHPREVFKEGINSNAASVIVAHNHPSGNPQPSREDIDVTKRLKEVSSVIGIDLLDHIIIGDGKYISLKEKGYI